MSKIAIIIGAGPAGLTAAYELLKRTDIKPVILEKSGDIGGISKTVNYKGNRIDIGGHRFFSKSDRVMNWWFNIMPVETVGQPTININYQNKSRTIDTVSTGVNAGADPDKVMLVRKRLSRIYFLRKFFTYPIQLSLDTLTKLGLWTTIAIMFSYLKAQLFPRNPESNLEDFMVNRFGKVLYNLFFKDYTEKVWGIPCNKISAEWGVQRIKGVSISKAIQHAIQSATKKKKVTSGDIAQKDTETSLIEQFLYPKFGPGQLWEEVARQVEEMGGKILMYHDVKRIYTSEANNAVTAIAAINNITGETSYMEGDYFFSTMPVQELVGGMDGSVPDDVREVAAGLQYRDFITVGILLKQMSFQDKKTGEWKPLQLEDTWIYIQEKDVKVGRLQLFNNWSPYMVKDPNTAWVGMEFFCNKTDDFWKKSDEEIKQLAIAELEKIGLASAGNVLDTTVLRVEKTYPAYFGTYERFDLVKEYVDKFENLFLVGRNGMHKYNNSDHSMLTAMVAVDNIATGVKQKANIWGINTEQEYHEETSKVSSREVLKDQNQLEESFSIDFKSFLSNNKFNRKLISFAFVAMFIQLVIFKFLYPFASFIHGDSFVYLESAYHNLDINTHPIGYSKFLRLFSVFFKSDILLVTFQYLLLEMSGLALLFTLFYFVNVSKVLKLVLFALMLFNPIFLHLANLVSSDALFLSLSLIWFSLLIWNIFKPRKSIILISGIVLFVAFTVRYNALYYPIIAFATVLLSKKFHYYKLLGLGIGMVFIIFFIVNTSNQYYKLTGVRQFSPFSGWQIANNALYAYRYVDSAKRKPVAKEFQSLDMMVRNYFDTTRDVKRHPQELLIASTVYMWDDRSPLELYKKKTFENDSISGGVKKWASQGPLYSRYGYHLIGKYPFEFMKYYLLPNAIKYYAPPVEFLEKYNDGKDSVQQIAQVWFDLKSKYVTTFNRNYKISVLDFYPLIIGALNSVFVLGLMSFIIMRGHNRYPILSKILTIAAILWIVNFGFSVFASPIALRFQLFPNMVFLLIDFLIIDFLFKEAKLGEISNIQEVMINHKISQETLSAK
ncbi:NAD(P)/FAD-dependent oxidoreductase [Olivibacter jilunii]|uniref:NAD(P)/FAD-dependent oxidoreductase n=1 Tax=Olivibacter jilunii TaxID=985016 RepID=UPI00102F397D|nr:NAD(P)-binding protein [Olivibacter jilunii]